MKWLYKISSLFGTDPFGSGELSEKVRTDGYGAMGGDNYNGMFEPSSSGHHDVNDYFSEDKDHPSIEKMLEDLKKKKKKRKKRGKIAFDNSAKIITSQWGSSGPHLPIWDQKNWVSNTYSDILRDEKEDAAALSKNKPQEEPQSTSSENNEQNPMEVAQISAVTIQATAGEESDIGSGFFIQPNIVLTCSHVVMPDGKSLNPNIVIKYAGKEYKGSIWAQDPTLDVAVLIVSDPSFKSPNFLKLGNSSECKMGDEIVVIGTPLGFENVIGKGIISSNPMDFNDPSGKKNYMFISTNISAGNSGGPVMKATDSSVIAMAAATIEQENGGGSGLNAAIPIDKIKPFLNKNGIKFEFQGGKI